MSYTSNLFSYVNHFEKFKHVKSHLLWGVLKRESVFVSIVIPTFRRPGLLKHAIDSAINQLEFTDYEIVIVDNDPEISIKTETRILIESYNEPRLRYYKHDQNIGMFANWNRGIELSNGEWITFLHDDDIFLPSLLNTVSLILRRNPLIEGIKAGQITFRQNNSLSSESVLKSFSGKKVKMGFWKLKIRDNFFRNSLQSPSGIFFKKQRIYEIGGFNPSFFPCSDYLFTTQYLINFNLFHTKSDLWICRIYQNESQNIETRIKTIEQNFLIRRYLGLLLGYKERIFKGLLIYQAQREINVLNQSQENLPENSLVKKLLDIKLRYNYLYQIIIRTFIIDQYRRRGLLINHLIVKSKSNYY